MIHGATVAMAWNVCGVLAAALDCTSADRDNQGMSRFSLKQVMMVVTVACVLFAFAPYYHVIFAPEYLFFF
jgi:hypothetical protein